MQRRFRYHYGYPSGINQSYYPIRIFFSWTTERISFETVFSYFSIIYLIFRILQLIQPFHISTAKCSTKKPVNNYILQVHLIS